MLKNSRQLSWSSQRLSQHNKLCRVGIRSTRSSDIGLIQPHVNMRASGDSFGSRWPPDRGMKSDVCRFVVVVMTARLRWCSGAFGRQVRKFFAFVSGLLALIWWMPASAQIYQEWVARYRGPAGSESVARAMVLDAATNIIVTGGSYGEYATVKYDSNGNEIWEARYHGPGLGDNFARAVAVDGARNSYVTGWSYGSSNNFDYATVKYDPNGNQLWVARYNSPENTNDFARVIAVDKAGNVYVTGTSAAQMEPF